MTYKILRKLCPNSFLERYNQVLVSHPAIQEIAKTSKALNIRLSAITKFSLLSSLGMK